MKNFDAAWHRVCELTEWKKLYQLADFLGIKAQSVSQAKSKDSFITDWARRIAIEYDSTVEWILDGKEPKRLPHFSQVNENFSGYEVRRDNGERLKHSGRIGSKLWDKASKDLAFDYSKPLLQREADFVQLMRECEGDDDFGKIVDQLIDLWLDCKGYLD